MRQVKRRHAGCSSILDTKMVLARSDQEKKKGVTFMRGNADEKI